MVTLRWELRPRVGALRDFMIVAEVYDWLMDSQRPESADTFTRHVFAASLSLCYIEAKGGYVNSALGLSHSDLLALAACFFPQRLSALSLWSLPADRQRPDDEECLMELLVQCCADQTGAGQWISLIMARRCARPNHLWQDLGLRTRDELSQVMQQYYPWLAARNSSDMKWKKFLYRIMCRDEGYGLCTAPSCAECDDFAACFGDESGESLLARIRLDHDRATTGTTAPA